MTGHQSGLITIALAEADNAERERRRTAMGGPYRTLLGHFRHEVGTITGTARCTMAARSTTFAPCSATRSRLWRCPRPASPPRTAGRLAGRLYQRLPQRPSLGGFAETWAHHIHMVDALESAAAFGLRIEPASLQADIATAELSIQP